MSAATRSTAPAGVRLRPLGRTDVPAAARIERDRHDVAAWGAVTFHEQLDDPGRVVALAVEDATTGELVAYGVLSTVAGTADLDNLTVRANHARRGIGRWLLAVLVAHAAERGAAEVLLEVRPDNTAAVALYTSAGFAEISRRRGYYAPGVDAVVMRRELTGTADG